MSKHWRGFAALDPEDIRENWSWKMKTILAAIILAFAVSAHAGNIGGGPHGGMSTGAMGPNGPGSTGAAMAGHASFGGAQGAQGSQGGRYYYGPRDGSVVDGYQPWPEAEMRQFQKK